MAGRTHQKNRTRQAIVDGCAELLDGGVTPTIDSIVEHTQISRATVYRYFKSVADIVLHVMSDRDVEATVGSVADAGPDVADRVAAAERAVNDYLFAHPDQVRQFEIGVIQRQIDDVALEDDRSARRLLYIDEAIAPIANELDDQTRERLRYGLAMPIGSEALIALLDSCKVDNDTARDVTRWVCEAIVEKALRERSA
ncbi:MAG: TetR/AcrR family transcriptional regulator [Pseudomonadota bacterium]